MEGVQTQFYRVPINIRRIKTLSGRDKTLWRQVEAFWEREGAYAMVAILLLKQSLKVAGWRDRFRGITSNFLAHICHLPLLAALSGDD